MITPIREIPAHTREMIHDDVAEVSDIERRSYEFPWSHGVFRDCLLAGYHCAVVEREGAVVGYSVLSIAAGDAHILNLCIDPLYRELGYGERLLDDILSAARRDGVNEIFLEVRPSNEKAIALYLKKGFRNIAYRPAYYQANDGREDAAVFSKQLNKNPG
ncbi:MAG: ribosomal protein S18-alanine N-acetyltransferase [Proteobacteria bacterium]|jgi:ribosomal-protein-alanine N-acetyltransferase|nr:ribosomal protein S18-alanine N-acetyltransferase [Pseudomonadota bacterium]MDA0992899.1 ribosomal protein S18-alanine N-acetyltransferase [Pseudomonadota bacterium]